MRSCRLPFLALLLCLFLTACSPQPPSYVSNVNDEYVLNNPLEFAPLSVYRAESTKDWPITLKPVDTLTGSNVKLNSGYYGPEAVAAQMANSGAYIFTTYSRPQEFGKSQPAGLICTAPVPTVFVGFEGCIIPSGFNRGASLSWHYNMELYKRAPLWVQQACKVDLNYKHYMQTLDESMATQWQRYLTLTKQSGSLQ